MLFPYVRNLLRITCFGTNKNDAFSFSGKLLAYRRGSQKKYLETQLLEMLATTTTRNSSNVTNNNGCSDAPIVAVGQMCATNNKAENLRQVKELIVKAKAEKAIMLFLPECCDFVGESRKNTLELSEPLTGGYTMQQYKNLAKEHEIWLSLGGLHESIVDPQTKEKSNKIYNTHALVDCKGQLVAKYSKLHMFDVDTPDFRFRESEVVMAGAKLELPVSTPIGCIGLQICYDMRFAEASLLMRKWGAQILTYPSAFSYHTGKAHWEILLKARAIENQCFVIAAAQIDFHNAKRQSYGHAMIIDPWGKTIADCGGVDKLAVAVAPIDLHAIEKIRRNMPTAMHRRNDIYTLATYGSGSVIAYEDRPFAQNVIQKETIFYETEHSFAFTNLRCVVEGHVLVSTKRRTPRLNGLQCNEMADLFTAVCKIQRMLEEYYGTTAATVTVQDGADAGQTVPHVHFHVMPRRKFDFQQNDQIYVKLDDRCEDKKDRTIEERIEEAQKYRQFLLNHM